ncbi:MAG: GGDEF domain-containing protein [Nitrospirota bacterium]
MGNAAVLSLTNVYARKRPNYLLRVFTIFSALSVVTILLLAGLGIYRIYHNHIISDAENDAVNIGYAIFEQEKDMLISYDSNSNAAIFVADKDFPVLDDRMKKYLHPMNMFKIKFFSKDKKIIYSTDHSIIGKVDDKNTTLSRALKGEVVSKIVKKGSVMDLAGEKRYDVDVVETYFPIIDKKHEIIGSFEVYIDVTRSYQQIKKVLLSSLSVLSIVLLFVFGFLFVLMRRLTDQLSTAQNELENIAVTDGLTKIYNRGHLIVRAEEEFLKTKRLIEKGMVSTFCGLIMFDVDHFKKINDRYGHPVGDEVLKEVSARLRNSLRKYDILGRYGGEEFLVILPNTSFEDTRVVAERIWRTIRERPFVIADLSINVTASMGIACFDGADNDLNHVLKRADDGLYKAKNEGRDMIAWI